MSSKRMIRKEKKRIFLEEKYRESRTLYRSILNDRTVSLEDKENAQRFLRNIPRNSSKVRLRNRCHKTGRGNGFYRLVGLCRHMFRHHAMSGDVPGLRKSSW